MTAFFDLCPNSTNANYQQQQLEKAIRRDTWLLRLRSMDGDSMSLHILCCNTPSLKLAELLVQSWGSYIRTPNMYGWLPIHCVCGDSVDVVSFLAEQDQEESNTVRRRMLYQKTYAKQDTVLHLACKKARRNNAASRETTLGRAPQVDCWYGLHRNLSRKRIRIRSFPCISHVDRALWISYIFCTTSIPSPWTCPRRKTGERPPPPLEQGAATQL
ncbi:hypothetical protein ACA910_005435 [Epithemia clementina (nom. ined.)]